MTGTESSEVKRSRFTNILGRGLWNRLPTCQIYYLRACRHVYPSALTYLQLILSLCRNWRSLIDLEVWSL